MGVISLGQLIQTTATIASSGTTSTPVSTEGLSLVGIQMPATFTSTSITFSVSTTLTGTYQPLYNASGAVSYTVAAGQYQAIDPKDFAGVFFFKIIAGSTEGAARNLTLSMKGI